MKTFKINSPLFVLPSLVGLVILLLSSCGTTRYNAAASHQTVDPVCGMAVDKNSEFTHTYEGIDYHFDSEDCLSVFRKNPERFAYGRQRYPASGNMAGMHMGWWGPVLGAIMVIGMTAAMVIGLNH